MKNTEKSFQEVIFTLQKYWSKIGCAIIQPTDLPVGAATFHPNSFFGTIDSKPISIAFLQASRRPNDGRFGKSSNRLQHYYQFQVLIKPVPKNILDIYLNSLKKLNIDNSIHDIQFIEDDWKNPTLGAWGMGWEIWLNGLEITQITYFQQMGSLDCYPITIEITYGLERIVAHIQNKKNVYELIWSKNYLQTITYGKLFLRNEVEHSKYNFEFATIEFLIEIFKKNLIEAELMIEKKLLFPAYELILHANHIFNLLESRQAISITERQNYILKIKEITKKIAKSYLKNKQHY
ncbi:Glycine--tRNA ligase alpha subunit [Buchnera aphidicola (Tetraneura ulmi)]|uniref:glycine--tRNA ligase subunit alpha n=1 Tax=Buchnera aphidicola TaxID=9 RepID=UPI003464D896